MAKFSAQPTQQIESPKVQQVAVPVRQTFEDKTHNYEDVDGLFHALKASNKNNEEFQDDGDLEVSPKEIRKFLKIMQFLMKGAGHE